jgi:hypothetical protein
VALPAYDGNFTTAPDSGGVVLRSGSVVVEAADRDKLLAKVRSGEAVDVELDIRAFLQAPAVHNANFLRVKDGALSKRAKTWANRPFLRDHAQGDLLARGGTVLKSEITDEGAAKVMRQTVRLSAPWAVEMAARGLMDTFSIGFRAVGEVTCSACKGDLRKCSHFPGDRLEDGSVVEAVFGDIEGVETSAVNAAAVANTGIESIRAQCSAYRGGTFHPPTIEALMDPKILENLGLLADASEAQAIVASKALRVEAEHSKAALADAETRLAAAQKQIDEGRAAQLKKDTDDLVAQRISEGRIILAHDKDGNALPSEEVETLRDLVGAFGLEHARKRSGGWEIKGPPPGSQVAKPDPTPAKASTVEKLTDRQAARAAQLGIDPIKYLDNLRAARAGKKE